jgi:ATP/maltotriose-dependent transcriptional regulator MalT
MIADSGMETWLASFAHIYAEALVERPELDEIGDRVAAIELDPGIARTMSGSMLFEAQGRLALARGDRDQAVARLKAAVEIDRAVRIGPPYKCSRSALATALPASQRAEAQGLAEEELAFARRVGLPRAIGFGLRAAGIVDGTAAGIDLLRESVAVLEGSPAQLELARSLVELGAALRRRKHRGDPRHPLTRGMDLAHRCGATRLVRRADEELHATGARPRRPATSGVDALTGSELRVARLAAAGSSNSEIAHSLHVSVKTVETHRSHVYRKLGISGPGALARLERELLQLRGFAQAVAEPG